ncbi:hypothetical protein [Pedococcus dokdonensis]|uniref:hypothetical protein n=1 Tax=Pedococcus dokdonensis TaxID=443156 RepID=UPI00156026C4|nr:hypothetical protein [Pedococcus dokdonensis]
MPTGDTGTGAGADSPAASALPGLAAPTADSALAMTGGFAWQLLLLAWLLLLVGAGVQITARRFALVR